MTPTTCENFVLKAFYGRWMLNRIYINNKLSACPCQDGAAACIPSARRGEVAVLPCIESHVDKDNVTHYVDTACEYHPDMSAMFDDDDGRNG